MARYFRVKNFEEFQHYKDRAPPWIKLYNSLLDDYEFSCLQDASKLHLIFIWLLASKLENRLPFDSKWIANKINATEPVDLDALLNSGFLIEISDVADCKQGASNTLAGSKQGAIPETEGETETEGEKKGAKPPRAKPKTDSNITMKTFLDTCKADDEKAIPEDDAVFKYSEEAKLPGEFVWLAWREFVARHIDRDKKYKGKRGWRQAFGNCVRGNWYELWAVGEDGYFLTKQGKQAQIAHKEAA